MTDEAERTQPRFELNSPVGPRYVDPPNLIDVMIEGVLQKVPVADLHRRVGMFDDEDETTYWVEYYLGDDCKTGKVVHRSANPFLKKWPAMTVTAGDVI